MPVHLVQLAMREAVYLLLVVNSLSTPSASDVECINWEELDGEMIIERAKCLSISNAFERLTTTSRIIHAPIHRSHRHMELFGAFQDATNVWV